MSVLPFRARTGVEPLELEESVPEIQALKHALWREQAELARVSAERCQLADAFQGQDMLMLNAKAERCFRRVAELRPGEVRSWFNLGKARFRNQAYEGARAAFNEAILLNPEPNVRSQIPFLDAVMNANDGHLGQALEQLDAVIPQLSAGQARQAEAIRDEIRAQLRRTPSASGP